VELMVVSGVRTSSGFEERIRFSEIELVDSHAIDTGVMHTLPEGNYFNGWDVNVAAVRIIKERRTVTFHKHAVSGQRRTLGSMVGTNRAHNTSQEFILRVKRKGENEHFVVRRYSDFRHLHKSIRTELPGKVLPSVPKKNKADASVSGLPSPALNGLNGDDNNSEASSVSSSSTQLTGLSVPGTANGTADASSLSLPVRGHRRGGSSASGNASERPSGERPRSPFLKPPGQEVGQNQRA
jgi:hypothetical protein